MSKHPSFSSYIPSISAGLVAVLVGFASTSVLIFQAATAAGGTPAHISSWILATCLGMAIPGIAFSLWYRVPIVTAWSTPGIALLATSLAGVPMSEAVGAFAVCGALLTLFGLTGWFERLLKKIPLSLASAMLAGILLRFGVGTFISLQTQGGLVFAMLLTYIALRRAAPRYAILGVLVVGVTAASTLGLLHVGDIHLQTASLVWTRPSLSLQTLLSIALPLFIVTLTSQNIPAVAAMRTYGYHPPISPLITGTGLATLILAPFGAFSITLAALTAAICMDKEAHEDPKQRYVAAVATGVFYLLVGVFGATVTAVIAAFPRELIAALSGIALLTPIGSSLALALKTDSEREAALLTFLVTASGISVAGVGSAFWGLIAGTLALLFSRWRVS